MVMEREIICLTIIFLGMVATASTACSNAFGDNCEYQCHCAGDAACRTDGSCPNRLCASGWEGEYCQRGNVAAGKSSSTSQSSTNDSYYASLALDGDMNQAFSKCSHTNTENQPWWQVDLGREFVLFTVKVVHVIEGDVRECKTTQKGTEYSGTMSTTRNGYTCAHWLDETIHVHRQKPATNSYNYCRNPDNEDGPWCYTTNSNKHWDYCNVQICYSQLKNFKIWMDSNFCHHYKGPVGFGQAVDIRCDTPVVGRYMKIQLMDSWTVLTLCEVTVQAFQYRVCPNKYYGPNCNNRCQCANDVPCYDDKTGRCPSETCNDRFSGRYCNIGLPSVSKDGASTPTSISVKWQYILHDSAYDAGKVERFDLRYQENKASSSSGYRVSFPSPGMMSANVTNLKPSTQYSFYIQLTYHSTKPGSVAAPPGPTANFQTASCSGYMITPVISVTSNTILTGLTWPNRARLVIDAQVPGMIAGCLKDLEVYARKTAGSNYIKSTKTDQTYTILGLAAFTDYDIKAIVRSPGGKEKESIQTIRTAEDVPAAPDITKLATSLTTLTLMLTPPDPPYGVITRYTIEIQKDGGNRTMADIGPTNLKPTFERLSSLTLHSIRARGWTSKGAGAWSNAINVITEENIPGPPRMQTTGKQSTTTLLLNWIPPKYNNGLLMPFMVICTVVFSYDPVVNSDKVKNEMKFNPGPDTTYLTVTGLTPATEYNCSIAAQTYRGYGPSVWLRVWTRPEEAMLPESLFFEVSLDATTDTTVTVIVKEMPESLENGAISKLRVGVEKLSNARRKRSAALATEEHSQLTDFKTAEANGYKGYIAAELDRNYSGSFVIGDGKTYGGYYNPPLETGSKCDVLFGMVFTAGEIETTSYRRYGKAISVKGRSTVALAVGLSVGFLVLLIAIIVPVVVVIRRRKATEESTGSQDHLQEEPMRMKPRKRDFPDSQCIGETNLAAIDQRDESVYEVIPTNKENTYELTDAGMSSGRVADFNSESKPSDTTDEPTYMYANTKRDSRVAVDNIYEEATRVNHQQTTDETFDKDRTNEAKQSSVDGGYEDPRFGQSDRPEGDAAASDTCEHQGGGQESKNTYQNLSEALDMTNDDGTYENLAYSP